MCVVSCVQAVTEISGGMVVLHAMWSSLVSVVTRCELFLSSVPCVQIVEDLTGRAGSFCSRDFRQMQLCEQFSHFVCREGNPRNGRVDVVSDTDALQ